MKVGGYEYPIRVRFLPPDFLTITSSYDESDKLILYIRNLGEHKISPKVRIVFPNEVSFKFKGVEFKKNEFTEEDYLKITGKKLEIEPGHEKRLVFHPVYEGRSVRDYGVTTIIVETEGLIIGKDLKTRLLGQKSVRGSFRSSRKPFDEDGRREAYPLRN